MKKKTISLIKYKNLASKNKGLLTINRKLKDHISALQCEIISQKKYISEQSLENLKLYGAYQAAISDGFSDPAKNKYSPGVSKKEWDRINRDLEDSEN